VTYGHYYNLWFYNCNYWAVDHSNDYLDPANANDAGGTIDIPEFGGNGGLLSGNGALCPFIMVRDHLVAEPLAGALGRDAERADIVPINRLQRGEAVVIRNTMAEVDVLDHIEAWAVKLHEGEVVVVDADSARAFAILGGQKSAPDGTVSMPGGCLGVALDVRNTAVACDMYRRAGLAGATCASDFLRRSRLHVSLIAGNGSVVGSAFISLVGGAVAKRVFVPIEGGEKLLQTLTVQIRADRRYWTVLGICGAGARREIDLGRSKFLRLSAVIGDEDVSCALRSNDGEVVTLYPGNELQLTCGKLRSEETVVLRIRGHYELLTRAEAASIREDRLGEPVHEIR